MFSLLHDRVGTCDRRARPGSNNKPVIIDEPPQFHPERSVASWTARPKPGILAGLPKYPDRAAVAQWIEYWPPKPRVAGSIPASRASPQGCVSETSFTSHSGGTGNTLGPDVLRLFRVQCQTPVWVTLLAFWSYPSVLLPGRDTHRSVRLLELIERGHKTCSRLCRSPQ